MKKNFQAFLGAILIVAFASPSKSEVQFSSSEADNCNRFERLDSIAILIVEINKPIGAKQ
jgi:hypothetical protein|tara:strand:- start:375 stop:554 length:180 start_codon:yes stop_codon:yes gene_type:complete